MMGTTPIVSVIIPVYNTEKYLPQCLESVLNQTFSDIEIICVDDGSTDNSLNILKEYAEKDSRLKIITQQNLHAGVARNTGIEYAKGEYFLFLDSDDYFELNMLEDTVRLAQTYDTDICIFGAWQFFPSDNKIQDISWMIYTEYLPMVQPFSAKDVANHIFQIATPAPWNKLFKASFVRQNQLRFQNLINTNDFCFVYTAMALAERIICTEKQYIYYRCGHEHSLQTTKAKHPLNFYYASLGLRQELIKRNVFQVFERSYNLCVNEFYDWNTAAFTTDVLPESERERIQKDLFAPIPSSPRPKFSIIIPVYNTERYLTDCMDSVVQQTLTDIEIIAVNDASTDNSPAILNRYAQEDKRVQVIHKEKNEGRLSAREAGVMAAHGLYVLFVDADDYIAQNTCAELWSYLEKKSVDILHCGVHVINHSDNTKHGEYLKRALQSKAISSIQAGEYLLKNAFVVRNITTSLWAKAFRLELCQMVYEKLPKDYPYVGEDIMMFFFLSLYTHSYQAIETQLYFYNYGVGIGRPDAISMQKYALYCNMSKGVEYTLQYLQKHQSAPIAMQAFEAMTQRMCEDCCRLFRDQIEPKNKPEAARMLVEHWKDYDVFALVLKQYMSCSFNEFVQKYIEMPVYYHPASKYEGTRMLPKISVIIPVYNVEKYLRKCMDSIVSQTMRELEIICINDGSLDESLSILEEYQQKDARIAVVSQINAGQSAARNAGMKVAHGKYIYFIDSDDWLAENALEILYTKAEKYQTDIILFSADCIFENDALAKQYMHHKNAYTRSPIEKQVLSGEELVNIFYKENGSMVSVCLQFFRRDFITESRVEFYEGIFHEDDLFSELIWIKAQRVYICTDSLYYRLIRENSTITQSLTYRHFNGRFVAFARLNAEAMLYPAAAEIQRTFLMNMSSVALKRAKEIYEKISEAERNRAVENLSPEYRNLCQWISWQNPSDSSNIVNDSGKYKYDLDMIRKSASFRIGRLITYIPRKIRGGIRCFQEHGWYYTLNRGLQHLHIIKKRGDSKTKL